MAYTSIRAKQGGKAIKRERRAARKPIRPVPPRPAPKPRPKLTPVGARPIREPERRKLAKTRRRSVRKIKAGKVQVGYPYSRKAVRRGGGFERTDTGKRVTGRGLIRAAKESERKTSLETITPMEAATLALTPPSFKALAIAGKGAKVIKALGKAKAVKGATKVAPRTVAKAGRVGKKIPPRAQGPLKKAVLAGAIASEPHSRRFVKRHAEATVEDPGKVLGTTARAAPGIVTAPAGIAINLGITGARVAKEGPTKRALEPTVETGKSIAKFTKDVSKIATSKSDKEAKDIIKNQYGLTALAIAAPAARIAAKPKSVKPPRQHEAKTPIGRYTARRRARRDVSRIAAEEQARARLAISRKTKATAVEASKAPRKRGGVKLSGEETQGLLGTLMEEGITGPNKAVIAKVRAKYRRQYKDEPELLASVERQLKDLEDPKAWQGRKAKPLAKAAEGARAVGKTQRYSERARLAEFQKTHGLKTVDEIAEGLLEQWTGRQPRKATGKIAVSKGVRRKAERRAAQIANKQVNAVRRELGLAEPEKFGHVPATPVKPTTASGGVFPQLGKKGHKIKLGEGSLAAKGRVARSGTALVRGTIATPEMMQASGRLVLRSIERGTVKKGRTLTQAEAARRLRTDHPDGTVVFLPHSFKSAVRQMDPKKLEDSLKELKDNLDADWTKLEAAGVKGPKGSLVEKAVAEELLAQVSKGEGAWERIATKPARLTSRAILHNPAWALGQVPATAATTAFVSPRLVRGGRAFKKLQRREPKAAEQIAAAAGRVPGAAGFESQALRVTPDAVGKIGQAAAAMHRTRTGRGVLKVLDSPGAFNRWSEGYIRSAGLSEAMLKQVRGPLARMRKLRKNHRDLYNELKGKPKDQQLEVLAKNRKVLDEIVADTGPVIGEFGRLTRSGLFPESALAPLAIFYPFMRMSVNFLTQLPMKHPVKSGISYHLAQWNADELKKFLGGDPSFFQEWSTVLTRTGKGGKPGGTIPLTRIAPGGSFIPETIGEVAGGSPANVLRAVNPVFGGIAAAATGVDPLTGKQIPGKDLARLKLGLSTAVGAPAAVRVFSTVQELDRKNILTKKDQTALTQLFNKLSPKKQKLIRGYVVPIWPREGQQAKDLAKAGRAMDALTKGKEARDAGDQAKASALYDRGYGLLNQLYAKYGLTKQAEREKKAYQEKRYGKKKEPSRDPAGILGSSAPKAVSPVKPKRDDPAGILGP
jgi:hypothetical protein